MNTSTLAQRGARILACLFLAASIPLLTGCFGIAAIGLGASGLVLSDRRAAETFLVDEGIEMRGTSRIREHLSDKVTVHVISYNRTVLLTGSVPDAERKAEVEKLVSGVPNVKAISNELEIAGAASFADAAYLTGKVKTRFLESKQFAAHHVKVVTDAGIVYLLGLVTQREADAAVEITRTTAGVRKVVRVFEYISEEQAQQMDSTATKPTATTKTK